MKTSARWIGFGRTETGHVRSSNQDVFAAINSCNFWIVADGMGGHPAGDLAAHIAVDVATQKAKTLKTHTKPQTETLAEELAACITAANRAIHEKVREDPSLRGMGTTVVAMMIMNNPAPTAYIAHLGDSRAYRYHKGMLTQLTRDHTLVELLLERGLINAATARAYPDRHVLAKGLGMGVDMRPDLHSTPLATEDLLLLCTDGLTKMLDNDAIALILSKADGNPKRACHDLVEEALRRGGEDNVTVIVCAYTTPERGGSVVIDRILPAM